MAKREKTSEAEIFSARLNPIHPEEKRVIEIIRQLEQRRFNFKQIVVDAILRADGATPEMFPRDAGLTANMERLLEQFAREIITEVQKRGGVIVSETDENDEGEMSPYMQNFARSFVERQRKIGSEEE